MPELLRKLICLILLTIPCIIFSQGSYAKEVDSILKVKKLNEQKRVFVDSVSIIPNYSQEKLSYIYHSYARYLNKENRIKEAIAYVRRAVVLRKLNHKNDLVSLKKSLFNLGYYLRKSGSYFMSIKIFKELVSLPEEDRLCIKAYSELITLYYRVGDYEKSINYFQKTTDYYILKQDFKNLYKNYIRISRVYALMDSNKYSEEIILYLRKADSLQSYTIITKRDRVLIYIEFGNVYEKINESKKALNYYQKALVQSKGLNDSSSMSMLNNNIGELFLKDSLFSQSNKALRKGVLYASKNAYTRAFVYNTYGGYYVKLKEFDEAIIYFEKAIQLLVFGSEYGDFTNPTIEQLSLKPNKLRLFDFIHQKAAYWKERYDDDGKNEYLTKALVDYKLADQLLDVIRFDSTEKTSKLFWREKGASLYMKAVEVCYLLGDMESAYFFMEKNKALLLLEELSDQQAKVVSNLPQQLIERDFIFKQKITKAEESTISNKTDIIFELKRSYEQFKDSLATNYPAYSKLRKSLPVLSLGNHVDNYINKDIATLQFIINENEGYGLSIIKKNTTLYVINDVITLQKEISELSKQLQQPFNTQTEVDTYVKNANSIFKKLVPPNVYEKIKGKQVTIAADGIIQNIPFEALISDFSNQNSYLIKTNEINYVYSFSYLLSNNKKIRNPEHTFLGFAPEQFQDKSLAVLPNSINEVISINSIFSDKTFIKDQASKLNFKTNFDNYKIVHLATHSGSSNTEKPWLAFSDDKVNLNEIYATQNQADLVVLSACKTSQGEMKTGEGVMSLARGFFFSGTNSVISTLWNINDKTTQEIMYSFYTNLKNGQTKSKALHESKLAYLSSNEGSMASPFYWSSFVLIGDSGIVSIKSNTNWILLILLLVVVIAIGVAFKKRNKK
jgi:CHAT domain-containing protein/Tfp pilus assembly protein PilF